MRNFIFVLLLITFLTAADNAKDRLREGTITYAIKYIKVPEEVQGMESMLPQEMKISFKGSKSRVFQSVMGGSQIFISDQQAKEGTMLMDMMGQKIAIAMPKEEMEKSAGINHEYVYHKEVRNILGYRCGKVTYKDEDGQEQEVYCTDELVIPTQMLGNFEGLKGSPLHYRTVKDGMVLEMTATEIDDSSVSDHLFKVPSDYQKMSMEELQEMMGG